MTEDGDATVRAFEKLDGSGVGAELGAFGGLCATYGFLSSGGRAREERQTLLTVGEHAVEEPDEQNGRKVYDLTAAIESHLAGLSPAGQVATVPLALTSVLRGIVTVEPPLIEYDLE